MRLSMKKCVRLWLLVRERRALTLTPLMALEAAALALSPQR